MKTTKTTNKPQEIDFNKAKTVFQGDIMITRVDKLPEDAKLHKDNVVAHSETGHHHVAERAKVFTVPDGMTLYMQAIGETVDIVHNRPFDTHQTLRLYGDAGAIYKIKRQREYTPQGWRQVAD